jgi:hypothetical protein
MGRYPSPEALAASRRFVAGRFCPAAAGAALEASFFALLDRPGDGSGHPSGDAEGSRAVPAPEAGP